MKKQNGPNGIKSYVLKDEDRYRLQALVSRTDALRMRRENMILQFLQTNSVARQAIDEEQAATSERDEAIRKVFRDFGLTEGDYRLDLGEGKFMYVGKSTNG